jgi:hypothetical protein
VWHVIKWLRLYCEGRTTVQLKFFSRAVGYFGMVKLAVHPLPTVNAGEAGGVSLTRLAYVFRPSSESAP